MSSKFSIRIYWSFCTFAGKWGSEISASFPYWYKIAVNYQLTTVPTTGTECGGKDSGGQSMEEAGQMSSPACAAQTYQCEWKHSAVL